MRHGEGDNPYQPFERESGIFVSNGEDGELRMHRDEKGRHHFHRWVFAPHDLRPDNVWRGPLAYGLTATDIYDAAEALRREAAKPPTGEQQPGTKKQAAHSSRP